MGAGEKVTESEKCLSERIQRRYRLHRLLFGLIDFLLRFFVKSGKSDRIPAPEAILLANAAYLGDVVISTSLLPILRHAFPQARIGFLTCSKSIVAIENHPLIDRIHILDHWFWFHKEKPLRYRFKTYFDQKRKVIQEIRREGYDVAIDLRQCFPNFIPLLWEAQIPHRIAYDTAGFVPLLTHVLPYRFELKHEARWQADLLKFLSISRESLAQQSGNLPAASEKAKMEVNFLLGGKGNQYRIIHMGSSTSLKDWPENKWKSLAKQLVQEGNTLVFTGQGEREELSVGRTTAGLDHCINACGRLSWDGLVELIRGAELLYAVETSVGHVAAAVGTPTVSIKDWRYSISRWKPFGDRSVAVHTALPCFPCYISRGCESMACVREISVEAVYQAGEQALKHKSISPKRINK